jgi:hypothetical protein
MIVAKVYGIKIFQGLFEEDKFWNKSNFD